MHRASPIALTDGPEANALFAGRIAAAQRQLRDLGVDAALFSLGADLPYLTGYEAMPLERLTMLVLPQDGQPTLVVPGLEAPRIVARGATFAIRPWHELEDPVSIVAGLIPSGRIAIGDRTWAMFLLRLQAALPQARFVSAREVVAPARMRKSVDEIAALRRAALAVDAVALEMAEQRYSGRSEAAISREIGDRIIAHGHQLVNFAIVGAGPNGASPHHEPSERIIEPGDAVVCDFGGTMDGYCSDITRMFVVQRPPEGFTEIYAVLRRAQEAAIDAVRPGITCEAVDGVARRIIDEAGYGPQFIHRTGHGIGMEAHEDPYIVSGNALVLAPGHAFSVEPGIYFAGRYGMRLEDIVVCGDSAGIALNQAPHDFFLVS